MWQLVAIDKTLVVCPGAQLEIEPYASFVHYNFVPQILEKHIDNMVTLRMGIIFTAPLLHQEKLSTSIAYISKEAKDTYTSI